MRYYFFGHIVHPYLSLVPCLLNCLTWCTAIICVQHMSCLNGFLDPTKHFIHQINLSVFLWHIRTKVIFATVHVLAATKTRFVSWNISPLIPLRSSTPESKDTTFLTLISVSPFWLDPSTEINYSPLQWLPPDRHKLISLLCCSYLVNLSVSPSLSPWKDSRQYTHQL